MTQRQNNSSRQIKREPAFLWAGIMVSLFVFTTPSSGASLSDEILKAPVTDVLDLASQVAEAMAKETPIQIDKVTKLIGAQFLKANKTFYYHYQTTIHLNVETLRPYVINKTCSDDIRRAFLRRGLTIRHQYEMPTGEVFATIQINQNTCPNHY